MSSSEAHDLNHWVYQGTVRHRRFTPKLNSFTYPLNMWFINLDKLAQLKPRWFSPFRFSASDYLSGLSTGKTEDNQPDLKQQVIEKVNAELGEKNIAQVFLLTQLRCFGYVINPISVFYCFDHAHQLIALVVEVTNTPWGQRIDYVLGCDPSKKRQRICFEKAMHVSPFNPMDMDYQWSNNTPDDQINVHLSCIKDQEKVLDATLILEKAYQPFSIKGFNMLMTWRIAGLIYWQAAKLFLLKRLPFYDNPTTAESVEKTS
ncbi:MAG: DUF1365 domain-containing protein [Pseudomonadales bacterium]|nr:DUF1365 domain-containing protein [Pseudomonadales bacterium]